MGIRAFCATAIARAIDAAVAEAVTKERAKYEEAIAARDRDAPIWQRIEAIAGGIVDPAVAAAVADERERCAAIVRGEVEETWRAMDDGEQLRRRVLLACARAIEGEAPAARTIREGAKP